MTYKVLLFGTGLGDNYGCDAIVLGTEQILRHRFPDCEVWLPHNTWREPQYEAILGTTNGITILAGKMARAAHLCRRVLEKVGLWAPRVLSVPTRAVTRCDCVLSIGGDLYTFSDKEENWPFPYPIVEAGNEIVRLGKPYIIWCASVGPLEKAGDRLGELVEHLRKCRAIIVREQDSYLYLRENLGLTHNVYLASDPAFVMEAEPFDFPLLNSRSSDKILAVNFSMGPLEHVYGHLPMAQFQSSLVLFVRKLLNKIPIRLLFVPHVRTDYELLYGIMDNIGETSSKRIHILPKKIGARKTKWAVSRANALVAMRFHCSLAGFSTITPTMILLSTAKGVKICKEMYGNMNYGVNIRDMDEDWVIPRIRELLDNEEMIRAGLATKCEEMKTRALGAGEILSRVLGASSVGETTAMTGER